MGCLMKGKTYFVGGKCIPRLGIGEDLFLKESWPSVNEELMQEPK